MGKEKTESQTLANQSQNQATRVEATPQEQELNRLLLERTRAGQPGMIQAQQQGLNLINQLLAGQELPGYLQTAVTGVSPEAIGYQAADLARQYGAGFQQQGLADSGVAFRETARGIANELLFPAEQFNIGTIQNALNLALSGQAQVQSPILGQTSALLGSLAGLRGLNTATSGSQFGRTNVWGMNPFWKSFQTSAGQSLGGIPSNINYSKGAWSYGG